MSEHTKIPWEARHHHIYAEDTNIHIADICRCSDGDWSEPNAQFIVTACNSYYKHKEKIDELNKLIDLSIKIKDEFFRIIVKRDKAIKELRETISDILNHVEDENIGRVANQCTLCKTYRDKARQALNSTENL